MHVVHRGRPVGVGVAVVGVGGAVLGASAGWAGIAVVGRL